MTSRPFNPDRAPDDASGSKHGPSPWRVVDDGVGYASIGNDDAPGFMSALRRFRARHGLQPTTQTPIVDDKDLDNLRAKDDDHRPDPFADLAD